MEMSSNLIEAAGPGVDGPDDPSGVALTKNRIDLSLTLISAST
jgi:hypothetical protein